MATTGNTNLKRIGRAATCAGLALLIAAQPALAMTATTSEADAYAHSRETVPEVTEGTKQADAWKTSDGQEFATEAEADAWAEAHSVTVSKGTKQVPHWKTSDGLEFASEADAKTWADAHKVTVGKTSRAADVWVTSDGLEFLDESQAKAHAEAATPKLSSEQRSDTVWETSDGQEFATEAEARAHARSTVAQGSKQVDVWTTSDGHEFASQPEADAHAESCALTVSAKTRTVHHDAVTHEEEVVTYCACANSPYKKIFDDIDEATQYWEDTARAHPEVAETMQAVYPIINYKTVVDVPAYDEQIPYWQTSDGAKFDAEADARDHARSTVPTVSRGTKVVPAWQTSDGKSFDAERDAYDYAESCALAVTSREKTYTVWIAPYDQEFDSREEAEAYLADLDALEAAGLAPFTDVSTSDWSFRWTVRAAARGLMSGYSGTTLFGPNDLLTRCQVATVLWRAAGSPEPTSVKSYPDVEGGSYYEKAVAWCSEQGIVTGYTGGPSAGRFCPWSNVTREELATMAARWARSRGHELAIDQEAVNDLHIDDWSYVSGWARDSITRTASSGILGGVDNGDGTHSLQPQGCATRAQAAKVFVVLQDAAR